VFLCLPPLNPTNYFTVVFRGNTKIACADWLCGC
jgi:hypothetical protein